MKTPVSKTLVSIIALLSAGAISLAQTTADSYVLPKATGPNFYLEASAAYMKDALKADGGDAPSSLKNLYGGNIAFGWRINKNNKIQIETGYYASSHSESDSGAGYSYTDKYDLTVIPVLFSYSYCIPLVQDGRGELRLTPIAGMYSMKLKDTYNETYNNTHSSYNDSYTDTPFAFGAGVGFTWHFTNRFYADAGLRYLFRGSMKSNNDTITKSSGVYGVTIAAGWKF